MGKRLLIEINDLINGDFVTYPFLLANCNRDEIKILNKETLAQIDFTLTWFCRWNEENK